jgi:ABC-type glycerol-3-phosphate transport system substrate-binding protein
MSLHHMSMQVEFMLQHNLANSHDGWILDPSGFGIVSKYGGFYDLTAAVNNPLLGLDWGDVLPLVRQRHVAYKGEVVAFPLDLNANLLFYNRDALQVLNRTQPPRTWQQLVEAAREANGKVVNNQTQFGICLERRKGGWARERFMKP